jgi:hypothetical protein
MRIQSLSRLLCIGCLAVAGAFAQDPAPAAPPPPPGGGGPGGGRGNFDPAQMRQAWMTRIQETLAATPDEWKVIEPLLTAVMEKERSAREMSGNPFRGRRGGQQPEQPAEIVAVEKAAAAGDAAVIKVTLEALRKARTERVAEATKAKDALRQVLSISQEAKLVVMGLLD